jgi:hypothetical protein
MNVRLKFAPFGPVVVMLDVDKLLLAAVVCRANCTLRVTTNYLRLIALARVVQHWAYLLCLCSDV